MSEERDRLVERMAEAIQDSMDGEDLHFPRSYAEIMADAALRVVETPPRREDAVIKLCTCGHSGYGKHMIGCELYVQDFHR